MIIMITIIRMMKLEVQKQLLTSQTTTLANGRFSGLSG